MLTIDLIIAGLVLGLVLCIVAAWLLWRSLVRDLAQLRLQWALRRWLREQGYTPRYRARW
jgi:apolipoprotein N-acyltransferase